jgi:hypothetical protein
METATTSTPFAPHLLQRMRFPTASSVAEAPHRRASAFRLGNALRSALAGDLHEEVTERIVEFLDMRQHSHAAASCG